MTALKKSFLGKFLLPWLLLALSLAGCTQLDQLQSGNSPEQWLASHSHVRIEIGPLDFILAEPSSTVFVYGLGLVLLWAAVRFYMHNKDSVAGKLWALGLLVWAVSTFSAGTSYQAFSYEIKCAGREICSWTSWWEIWYMALFVVSMGLIAAGVGFSSLERPARKALLVYLGLITLAYQILLFVGAFLPVQWMVSFEVMLLFVVPTFLVLFAINLRGTLRRKESLDLRLVWAWVLMGLVTAAYFAFLLSGIAGQLWQAGIWFNANDVLHLGLIGWVAYLITRCQRLIADKDAA